MSRATAQLNSLRMIFKVRLAWIGAPRAKISSSMAMMSRRVMSFALRLPKR
jgi:hypothetical protein